MPYKSPKALRLWNIQNTLLYFYAALCGDERPQEKKKTGGTDGGSFLVARPPRWRKLFFLSDSSLRLLLEAPFQEGRLVPR